MGRTIMRITTIPIALKVLLEGQMRFIRENGFEVIMVSSDGKERVDLIKQEECTHVIVDMTRKVTPFKDISSLIRLIKVIKKYKPDIVHTHTPKAGLLGMIAAAVCSVSIRIHTVAGLPLMVEKGGKFQLLKLVEKITFSCATNVWPNSKSLYKYIKSNKLTKEKKLTLIGNGSSNGIDLDRFNPSRLDTTKIQELKSAIQYSPHLTYLLFAGRMVYDKGIVELVEGYTSLVTENPALKLILIGPYEKSLDPLPIETISKLENSSIIHINWTEHIEYYMGIADYFIFPSHREGFPNVLLQAGAMGLPIIASNISGNVDIIEHEETGFLFECGNTNSLKEAILYALKHKEVAASYAVRLESKVHDKFNRPLVQQAILDEYNRLLKKKST